ncbi:ikke-1 [Pristionchus pacificus]|uniref:IkappaB kinase n=1 Tax=Pristionchus pacificus TaxID=54126 RepID=A0A2A6BPJ3_PRIPA|nr:ikke-1 [Pristionchus pacificus]|eukprot:PDM67703.1 ikke-1 [Pristionchus pacificus]
MRRAFFSPPPFTFDDRVVIGEGSFGKVFFGTLTATKTPICVKVTKDGSDHTFEREFELLAKLKGKDAIIQTYGYSDTGSFRCIVLERADGALEHLLNLPRHSLGLPMQTVLDLVGDLAKALTVLFEMKVAHRDIKPMNILYFADRDSPRIGERYTFKLCDFGGGRSVVDVEYSFQTIGGTLHYMAPQVLARYLRSHDKPSMNAEKIDLWSLGITLFRCVTGHLPFDPRPFSPHKLLRMIDERPNNRVIAHRGGKFEEKLHAVIHPRWFQDTMTVMIRLLLHQKNSENIAMLMTELSKLRSRVVYNVRKNVFYISHPQLEERHMWFMEEWKLKPAQVDVDDEARVCVLNEGKEVRFLGAGEADRFSKSLYDNVNMTWRRQQDEKWLRQRKAAPLSQINDVPGNFLIVCERPLDRMRKAPPAVSPKELVRQIEDNFASLSPDTCAGIAHYDLLALQEFIENTHRISYTIESQRRVAIKKMKEALDRSQLRPNTELRDRAVITFKTRTPDEFRMFDDLQEATLVVYNCLQILEDLDEKRSATRPEENKKKKQELIAMAKYIATAERNLQEAVVKNCKMMMSSLRRIIEFNEMADNLEAETDGRPLPHDLSPGPVVHHVISKNDLRYEPPPGNGRSPVLPRKFTPPSPGSNNNGDPLSSPEVKPPWIEKRLIKSAKKAENMCKVS